LFQNHSFLCSKNRFVPHSGSAASFFGTHFAIARGSECD
jgi:hypothetical protein